MDKVVKVSPLLSKTYFQVVSVLSPMRFERVGIIKRPVANFAPELRSLNVGVGSAMVRELSLGIERLWAYGTVESRLSLLRGWRHGSTVHSATSEFEYLVSAVSLLLLGTMGLEVWDLLVLNFTSTWKARRGTGL